jgi:hypothetical protein
VSRREERDERQRLVGDLRPRDAEHVDPAYAQIGVPAPVALEGSPAGVERVAVDLDGQAVLGPEDIDFVAFDDHVRLRLGQARLPDQLEESALGFGAREAGVGVHRAFHCGDPAVVGVAGELRFEGMV